MRSGVTSKGTSLLMLDADYDDDFASYKRDASEIRISETLITQGMAAGIVAGVFFTAALVSRKYCSDDPFMIQFLPFSIAFGVILCLIIGAVMWVPARFFDANLN